MAEVVYALGEGGVVPVRGLPGDAGLDLCAVSRVVVGAGGRVRVPTGLFLGLPVGLCGLVLPRSGLAFRYGLTVTNSPGLIDPSYRGEVMVLLSNTGSETVDLPAGSKVAQLLVVGFEPVVFREVGLDGLGVTVRGDRGFGSTGLGVDGG